MTWKATARANIEVVVDPDTYGANAPIADVLAAVATKLREDVGDLTPSANIEVVLDPHTYGANAPIADVLAAVATKLREDVGDLTPSAEGSFNVDLWWHEDIDEAGDRADDKTPAGA